MPWTVTVQPHPGSSTQDIANEPEWGLGHEHRIGFKNRSNRLPGITHKEDRHHEDAVEEEKEQAQLQEEAKEGKLLNFRDLIQHQEVRQVSNSQNVWLTSTGLPLEIP